MTLRQLLIGASFCVCPIVCGAQNFLQDFVQNTVRDFNESDIQFQRSASNAPFIPIAYMSVRSYGESTITNSRNDAQLQVTQDGASAFGLLPVLLSDRDALFTGAYVATTHFDPNFNDDDGDNNPIDDFRVDTVGVLLALFRQVNPNWQAAAFVMPFGHRSTQESSDWSLQTMGGAFARYTQNERLWWAFGVFGDHNPSDSYVLPYVGLSYVVNPQWTISAIMPWPQVIYAPTEDWMFSLGASPSGASWSVNPSSAIPLNDFEASDVAVNIDAWDFGFSAERRLHKNLWVSARAGVGGLRGLRLNSNKGSLEDADIDVGASGFFTLSLKLRPAFLP